MSDALADADDRPAIRPTPFRWADPKSIPPRRWLYGRHYIRQYATATIAPGGLGKTSLALAEAVAMASGRPLLDVAPRRQMRVWYWNGEDPREEVERRLAAICLHYGIRPGDLDGWLFFDSGRDMPITIVRRAGDQVAVQVPVVKAIKACIAELGIEVMIVDPFVSCHEAPENDNGAIDRVTKAWAGIAGGTDSAVELVHHVRKGNGAAGYSVEDARGGSALIGAVRSARVLNVMSSDEASAARIPAEQRGLYFRVDNGKANMQPPQDRAAWRHLVSVGLGNGDNEDPEDIIGVVEAWQLPGLTDNLQTGDVRKVQSAIAEGSWAADVRAGNWAGSVIASALGLSLDDASDKKQVIKLIEYWKKNGCLKTVAKHNPRTGREQTMIVVGEVF